jgi:hypothetical protein
LVEAILGFGKADEIVRLIESSSSDVVDEACSLITPEKFFNSRSSRGGFIDETVLSSLPGRFIIDVLRYLAEEARVRRPFTLERLTREAQFEVLNTLTTDEIHSYRGDLMKSAADSYFKQHIAGHTLVLLAQVNSHLRQITSDAERRYADLDARLAALERLLNNRS